jgi:hypothetical protein
MGCLIVLLTWLSPRFVVGLLYLFTERLTIAFSSGWVGIVGFLLFPYATAIYALAYAPVRGVTGIGWVLVVLGLLADLAAHVGGGMGVRNR